MVASETLINDGNVVVAPRPSKVENGTVKEQTHRSGGKSAVLHRSMHEDPLRVVSAKNHTLQLSNGQRIFDATGGAAVSCLGHGNARVHKAVQEQMETVSYCHSLFYGTEVAEELADLLVQSTYGEMARVFVVSSGSAAIEAAMKLARQFHMEKKPSEPQRTRFIARQQSYHGTTLGALGVGGHVSRRALFEPMLSENTSRVSPCYQYRGRGANETEESYVQRLEAELEAEFQMVGPENVAAFFAEPVVGAALGCVPAVKGYFQAMRRVCDKYGALLVLDEVMCGVGRIGPEPSERYPNPVHAWQDPVVGGAVPDIMVMGKGLGGGYMPVAAMMIGRRVVDILDAGTGAFMHGQTYQGHPIACRAALEVQKIIRDDDLMPNVRKQGKLLGKLLEQKLASHPHVGDIRGKGLFWGIEFVRDKAAQTPFEPAEGVAMGIFELAMQEPFNISLYPGNGTMDGKRGDHVLIAPAYHVTGDEIQHIVDTTAAVIEQFFRKFE